VISDVDGTVTKSDSLGHLLPTISFGAISWAHLGIASLFTNIRKNGYQMLYLTARPIGLSAKTKNYVLNIK
jgi:phosphatidate phosphatase LPIN